jgi:hypothetical protein
MFVFYLYMSILLANIPGRGYAERKNRTWPQANTKAAA